MEEEFKLKPCAQCGKDIRFTWYVAESYAYKRGAKYFCGYKCLRAYDKEQEQKRAEQAEKRRLARERKTNEQQ